MNPILDHLFVYSFIFRLSVKEKSIVLNVWNVYHVNYFKKRLNLGKLGTENLNQWLGDKIANNV